MPASVGHPTRRLLMALLLGAFLATGSGAAALELAWHAIHENDRHAPTPHFEAGGGSVHADHCQLGLAHPVGWPAADPPGRGLDVPPCGPGSVAHASSPPAASPRATGFPRAPPALG